MNEEEIKHKQVMPFIKKELGYGDSNIEFEKRIKVGSNTNLFLDIAVYIDDNKETISFVLDTKKQGAFLKNYQEQVISYGLLLRSPYSLLTDGSHSLLYDTKSKKEIYAGKLDGLKAYLSKKVAEKSVESIFFTEEEKRNAEKTLVIFEKRENFILTLEDCENIIRDSDGKTGADSFKELSKILFIKIFSEKDGSEATFSDQGKVGLDVIFERAKKQHPYLFESGEKIDLKDVTIDKLIAKLKDYSFIKTDIDIKGKAFEVFIGNTLTGKLGQFFTPRTIVDFIVNFLPPKYECPDDKSPTKIADTSCGSGGFLINILQNIFVTISQIDNEDKAESLKNRFIKNQLYGFDIAPDLVRTSKMNMVLHGDGHGAIHKRDGLLLGHGKDKQYKEYFDYIYTNPPFGNKNDENDLLKLYSITDHLSTGGRIDREILFTEQFMNLLKRGGYLSVVLPNGILNNAKNIYIKIRELLKNNFIIIAVIGLPDRSFKSSGANSHTSILFAKKKKNMDEKQSSDIFMAVANEVGYERKTKQAIRIGENDLDTILSTYKEYKFSNHSNAPLKNVYKLDSRSFILPFDKLEDRIDANYYYCKYMIDVGGDSQSLGELCTISTAKIHDQFGVYKYIQFSDISEQTGEIVSFSQEGQITELPDRAQMLLREDCVICARVFDSEKNIALVSKDFSKQIASTGFVILEPRKNIPCQLLYHYMRLPSTLKQVRYFCSGTILPSCKDKDILKIRVPVIKDKKKIERIVAQVNRIEGYRKILRQELKNLATL